MKVSRKTEFPANGLLQSFAPLRLCIRMVYALLRLVVPTNPKQLAFVSHPDCSDNSYALFEYILESPRAREFRIVWLATEPKAAESIMRRDYPDLDPSRVRVVKKNALRGLFWFLRSRYVFFTAGVYWFARSGHHQTIVNLWHGMPMKRIGTFDPREFSQPPYAHFSLATSEYWADLLAQAFAMPRDRVLVTGLPRNRWLLQPDSRHAKLRGAFSRLIVWLPTFRQWDDGRRTWRDAAADVPDPVSIEALANLDRRLEGADVIVVLKLHPGDARNAITWPVYRNIRVYSHQAFQAEGLNVYRLLACADALVTDFSSIAIDFLLVRKPIGFFVPDVGAYARGFMPGVWERMASVGPRLESLEQLAAFIRNPAPPPPISSEIEDLHRSDLREPSAAVLRGVGLGSLLHAAAEQDCARCPATRDDERSECLQVESAR